MLDNEQKLLSLSGSFEALYKTHDQLVKGKIQSPKEISEYLLSNMEHINKQMIELEKEKVGQ